MSKKNRRLESLFLLSKIISTSGDCEELKQDILSGDLDWLTIVDIANTHYLTAALYYSLLDKDLLKYIDDKELLAYLEQIYTINLHRNQQIVEQSKELNDMLTEQGIKPVFLKGAASLLQNDYQNVGMRFLSDIDFCIFEKDFQEAIEQMQSFGYSPYIITEGLNGDLHHHWWPMIHPSWDIHIEPHRRILGYSYSHFIECNEKNIQNSDCCINLSILSPTFRLIHAYIHSDIVDRMYEHKKINLRQLYEQSLIIKKYDKQIDWEYIESIFKKHKILNKFNYNLNLINELFRVQSPILKYNSGSKINLRILYLFFKYRKSLLIHIFSNFQTLKFVLSNMALNDMCTILTKKDYIFCMFKRLKRGFSNWQEGKYKFLP